MQQGRALHNRHRGRAMPWHNMHPWHPAHHSRHAFIALQITALQCIAMKSPPAEYAPVAGSNTSTALPSAWSQLMGFMW